MKRTLVLLLLVVLVFVACKPEPKTIQVTNLILDKTSVVIEAGNTVTITASFLPEKASNKTFIWKSSDETIATVEDGVVTGLKEGVVTISAVSYDGKKAECSVMVMDHPVSVMIPHQFFIAPKGENLNITCNVDSGDNDVAYQWFKSDDGSIENGTIIQNAVDATLSLTPFENVGLNYYFCQARSIYHDQEGNEHESSAVNSNVVTVAYTGLPTVYVNTPNEIPITSKDDWIKGATIEIKGSLNDEWNLEKMNTDIKGRGNTTWVMPKKPYALKLSKKKAILENLNSKHKRWVLLANYADKSLLRFLLAAKLSNEVFDKMKWAPSFESVDLVLNGEYVGNYILGEQIKIDDNRVNISKTLKGFVVEIDARIDSDSEEDYVFKTDRNVPIRLKDYDDDTFTDKTEFGLFVEGIIQNAEDKLFSDAFKEADGYASVLDVDSFVDYYLVNEIAKNVDANERFSVYMYYNPEDALLYKGPIWDFDISFGNANYNGCDSHEGLWIANGTWQKRLMEDEAFRLKVKQRFEELELRIFKAVNIWVREQANKIKTSAEINFEKWDILGKYVWPNADGYEQRTTYESEVEYLIEWTNNRLDWLSNEFMSW